MFDDPGIDVDEIAWIERDQFVYFMEMEHQLGDPTDWPAFRVGLGEALAAAFGWLPEAPEGTDDAVLGRLDSARETADPTTEWDRFLEAVWSTLSRRRLPIGAP